jgi:flagellar basal-body rod protein FlgG
MLRGLYTAAAGMISEQRRHDAVTNNIANLNTPGYKQIRTPERSFAELLISRVRGTAEGKNAEPIGYLNTGVYAEENVPVFRQGDLQETSNPYDFALVSDIQVEGVAFDATGKSVAPTGEVTFQPQAFFTVVDGNGERKYTRDGKFTLDSLGRMVTGGGDLVLGTDGQPLSLRDPLTGEIWNQVRIQDDGILVRPGGQALRDAAGQPLGLLITRVDNPYKLVREGNGLYRVNPDDPVNTAPVNPGGQVQIRQGYIERSNVDPAQSMVDMTAALRAYEANQKVIQFYDKSLDKAVNEVGRV